MTDPTIWRPTVLPIDPHTAPDRGFATMRVTSPYGNRTLDGVTRFHDGLDIGNAREGDQLVADADGIVVVAGAPGWPWSQPTTRYPEGNYGGIMVVIDHGGWSSVYAHMQPVIEVARGQRVSLGQQLGQVGATGAARDGGAHVHYGHLMASVQTIIALQDRAKPTRDPWTMIDPTGPMPLARQSELERKIDAVHQLRRDNPEAARRWIRRTGMTVEDEGKVLTRLMRVTVEIAALREADAARKGVI